MPNFKVNMTDELFFMINLEFFTGPYIFKETLLK